jgi:hypothetical protein
MNNEPQTWSGLLIRQRLFVGSKSEGDYWVLLTDDGLWYRLADPHTFFSDIEMQSYEGKNVSLIAQLDLLRGHRRLVLMSEQLTEEQSHDSPNTAADSEG